MKSQGRISLPAFQLTRRNHLPTLWRFLVGLSRGVKSKDLMQNRCHGVYQALLNTVPALFQHVQPKSQKDPKSIKKRLCQQHDCLVKLLTCIQHHQSVLLGIGSHCLGVPVGPLQGVQYHLSRFREGQIQTNIAYEIEPNTLRGLWSMQSYKFRLKFPCFTSRRLTQANQQICFRCVCVCVEAHGHEHALTCTVVAIIVKVQGCSNISTSLNSFAEQLLTWSWLHVLTACRVLHIPKRSQRFPALRLKGAELLMISYTLSHCSHFMSVAYWIGKHHLQSTPARASWSEEILLKSKVVYGILFNFPHFSPT